ncbi:MAG: 2-oxoglutarate dehydrogenase E1 component, partial [Candidatus Acidiferrum sp.]
MAHRTTLEAEQSAKPAKTVNKSAAEESRQRVFDAFRRWGYYEATLDPIGLFAPQRHPDLEISGPVAEQARGYYCGTIGAEFMHLPEPERRAWIAERLETLAAPKPDQAKILERLIRA